mgnify:CR=1 FL=1
MDDHTGNQPSFKQNTRRSSVASTKDGIALAAELIDSGKALETLERFIAVSNRAEANA